MSQRPTELLSREHRQIERALDVLLAMAEQTPSIPVADARSIVAFLRRYADDLHHYKEERVLFPALEAMGFSRHAGPIAVMLSEHDEGRSLIRSLAEASKDQTLDGPKFRAAARAFASLLRAHIAKEDGVLFPMADTTLPDWKAGEVIAAMTQHNQSLEAESQEQLTALEVLVARYGAAAA